MYMALHMSTLYLGFILRHQAQFIYGMHNDNIIANGRNIRIITPYVVETKRFPFSKSLRAMASPSLFFKPLVKPMSRKCSQVITEDKVSQIPYNSEFT